MLSALCFVHLPVLSFEFVFDWKFSLVNKTIEATGNFTCPPDWTKHPFSLALEQGRIQDFEMGGEFV